ncbi:hypothetical protein BG006_006837 [Podila minutissima]|uniref:Uncharacterized protein n=1 Tax=Podila minutissima TaxID=64525 RepID=A0A9P5VL33_9FUNG|nr:hypothetical protein BG006_006837 [Podila minutissima]
MTLSTYLEFPIRVRGILFDMDGTLIDTTLIVEKHWKRWCEEHGIDYPTLIASSHGRSCKVVVGEFAPLHLRDHFLTDEHIRQFEDSVTVDKKGMIVIPGAVELLGPLPQTLWAVVTSAGHDMAVQRFAQIGVEPPVLVTIVHVARGKPAPDGYLLGAEKIGLNPRDLLSLRTRRRGSGRHCGRGKSYYWDADGDNGCRESEGGRGQVGDQEFSGVGGEIG